MAEGAKRVTHESIHRLAELPGVTAHEIGKSREGRPITGLKFGNGPLRVSIVAGAHSDEPAGPMAALELAEILSQPHWQDHLTCRICPDVNPDGAAINATWFEHEVTLEKYARQAFREPPGEDVEFCYPGGPTAWNPRPENLAVAAFLKENAPYDLHCSLHGMGFAEGAWWLIGRDWVERTTELRKEIAGRFAGMNLGVHDIERRGEKGFHRIQPGFATTPTSVAMREYFLAQGDDGMAQKFLPNSMEYVASLGGDPLLMVSEIPIFRLTRGGTMSNPPGDDTPFLNFRPRFREARNRLLEGNPGPLAELAQEFGVERVPWDLQVNAIVAGVMAGIEFVVEEKTHNGGKA